MSTIIDAKGKPCPTPVILAKQAMAAGEHSFTVLVDNATAVAVSYTHLTLPTTERV